MAAAGSGRGEVSPEDEADDVVDAPVDDPADDPDDPADDQADAAEVDDATAGASADEEPAEEPGPGPAAPWDGRPAAVRLLVAVALLGVLLGAAGLLAPRVQASMGEAGVRSAAVDAATQFVVDINTYDSADAREYQQRMRPQLTRRGARDFDALTDGLFPNLQGQQLVSRDAQVVGSAVDTIDGDSASVLVAANATVVRGEQSPGEYPTRWRIELQRGGDDWTVSSWELVGSRSNSGAPAVPGQVAPTATPAPTLTPTPTAGAGS